MLNFVSYVFFTLFFLLGRGGGRLPGGGFWSGYAELSNSQCSVQLYANPHSPPFCHTFGRLTLFCQSLTFFGFKSLSNVTFAGLQISVDHMHSGVFVHIQKSLCETMTPPAISPRPAMAIVACLQVYIKSTKPKID